MIIVSSLSSNHINNDQQSRCTMSWTKYADVYCLQSLDECKALESLYPYITFIPTTRTVERLIKKKLVSINAIIDFAKDEDLFIINSDILLHDVPELRDDCITVFQRTDYTELFSDGTPFKNGFDGFHIPNKFLNIFPPMPYALGACWWDYWIPYRAIRENIPMRLITGHAFHKKHDIQWQQKEWMMYAAIFKAENDIPITVPGQMGNYVLQTIKNAL